jgi:hypothetical protein
MISYITKRFQLHCLCSVISRHELGRKCLKSSNLVVFYRCVTEFVRIAEK